MKSVGVALPLDGLATCGGEIFVGSEEVTATEETAVGGQRGWVWRGQHEMSGMVDERRFAYGVGTPEHEDDAIEGA